MTIDVVYVERLPKTGDAEFYNIGLDVNGSRLEKRMFLSGCLVASYSLDGALKYSIDLLLRKVANDR